ncbi:HTH-type dhaKLM operon transcriptional activator dhaS, partial [Dysosmobacter welbionis]
GGPPLCGVVRPGTVGPRPSAGGHPGRIPGHRQDSVRASTPAGEFPAGALLSQILQPGRKVGHGLGDLQLLRTDRLAAAAADAGAGPLVLRQSREGHGGQEAAAGEGMLVVQRQQGGDIQPLRTVADAVVAGGAGKGGLADHALGLGQQAVHLPAAEGNPHLESGDVGLHLLQVGHAGENHGDAGNGLQKPEGPGRDGFLGAHGPQGGGLLVGKA